MVCESQADDDCSLLDPANLDMLLRSAMAFRWDGVFLLSDCCDPFNDKALRASGGASFQLPVVSGGWTCLDALRRVFHMKIVPIPRYEQGNFLGPTILCDVATNMECYKEEMFRPVLCMQADRFEEAIAILPSLGVAARKFQNDVESGLVGINVAVPIPLPFSSVNGSKASFSGDLNFCGKAGLQFYTQIKAVAQQWKDLPTRRQEGALAMPSISERDSVNLKVSLLMPLAAQIDAAGQGESSPLCSVSERTYPCQTSQWGDPLPLISQSTETAPSTAKKVYMAPNSQRIDTLAPGIQRTDAVDASDSERLYFPVTCSSEINPIFLRNDSVSPMSLRHDIQMTDINVHPASEMVYMPVMSKLKKNVGPTSQRTGVLHLKPDKMYMTSHRRDGMGMMPLMAKASVPPASGSLYMSTSRSNVMASTSDEMSVPTEIQHDGISSKSERLFMPASSQGINAENQLMSAHNYRGQITPQTHPSSQSLLDATFPYNSNAERYNFSLAWL
ncbi:unnamed protein product [Coffea canephora]|uniref:Aldehyde dehydrogenase domain-containing protein n=1 Tax=Coffea canephora TaxID=49390 RepID=A0A068TZV6_COFCA|nr:unnamed protein product [Coffea canephora]